MAQNSLWQNKICAVSLTYDDALNVHLDKVIPLLDSLDFRATFYLTGYFPGFSERLNDWKAAAGKGNELGNHTLFHPCEGKAPGREWVNPEYDLNRYSVERMSDEIRMTNILLYALDGKTNRTFAYPCGDKLAGNLSYVDGIKDRFTGARSVQAKMQAKNEIDLFDIGSYMINGQSGDEMIKLVKEAMNKKALLVFLFHGVGGEHNINVSLEAHSKLLHFLKENEKEIWVAPLNEIAEYISKSKE
ncbi:MAG: polysaccharide deacetylase family protein [Ignavibacteria bacterium]